MDTLTYYRIKKMSPLFLVADINLSIKFYTNELNFDIDFLYEDFYAGIIKDGYSIHLKVSDYSIEKRKNKKNNEDINITFSVSNIKDLYEELSHKSIEIVQTLRDMPYGKEFYVADPDGNIISFLEEV
jgi:catechol 2,3-dioxygenase-like lactoylglutathione lyase family enzyme